MATSLDKFSGNLDESQLKILSRFFTPEQLPLLRRKGVFPYEYLDSFEKLNKTRLPSKEAFYSKLNAKGITDKGYFYTQKVWRKFNMKTIKDYLELYNKIDVLLLVDENFRSVCLENYDLGPSHYNTEPGLAWDAALKITKVKLELLSDPDMLSAVEEGSRGSRGGVSMCTKRYAKANNRYMGSIYDSNKPSKYLLYIDASSLYPWEMSKPLPTHGFEWMNEEELENRKKYSMNV